MRFEHIFLSVFLAIYSSCAAFCGELELRKDPGKEILINENALEDYLIPYNHPLNSYLKIIFKNPNMFKSSAHFRKAGFNVNRRQRKIMVAGYPHIEEYLFKKFPDSTPQAKQLHNFVRRIKGARVLQNYITKYNFKHLVVPKKWLYKLPKSFSKEDEARSYILIVENMDIYGDFDEPNGIARQLYYNMDIEMLTEFCTILHAVGGCDAYPRNQPFTRSGKIAFVDTEHVGHMKGHFIKHIIPALNKELQAYAWALWAKLEEEEQVE